MSKRYRYDTGNIIDQNTGEILTDIKTRNRLNQQDQKIKELQKTLTDIKTLIKNNMETERTHIGYNVLKQLWEQIQ